MNDLIILKTKLTHMSWEQVTALSSKVGVPFHTIAKIKRGITKNPRFETVEKLVKGLS